MSKCDQVQSTKEGLKGPILWSRWGYREGAYVYLQVYVGTFAVPPARPQNGPFQALLGGLHLIALAHLGQCSSCARERRGCLLTGGEGRGTEGHERGRCVRVRERQRNLTCKRSERRRSKTAENTYIDNTFYYSRFCTPARGRSGGAIHTHIGISTGDPKSCLYREHILTREENIFYIAC